MTNVTYIDTKHMKVFVDGKQQWRPINYYCYEKHRLVPVTNSGEFVLFKYDGSVHIIPADA